MSRKIRVGIVGYGNLGRGVELAIGKTEDMELAAVFSRRELGETLSGVPSILVGEAEKYQNLIDVMLLCGGSATDLIEQGPYFSSLFNTVDSFDTHAKIPDYFDLMDRSAKKSGKVAALSIGWDPGLFSMQRLMAEAVLPNGTDYTFWGTGVSQGHSDAIRRIPGVKNAKQYTVPKQEIIDDVRNGCSPTTNASQAHIRSCYVVAEEQADTAVIEKEIKTMPHYFAGYETHVAFISEQEFQEKHSGMPHGGLVLRTGKTSPSANHVIEFGLKLDSNPEFTASVLIAYARATFRLAQHGFKGACTVFDIPLGWLSSKSPSELRKELL